MAGYCLYSNSTILVMSTKNKLNMYQLNNNNQFELIIEDHRIPVIGSTYGINESNRTNWDPKVQKYVDKLVIHKKTQRWVGSLVADAHRTIMSGGVFMYPNDSKYINGKIRLLYEALPMAFIFENSTGYSSNGNKSILDLEITDNIHQKIPIFLFSKSEYELFTLV